MLLKTEDKLRNILLLIGIVTGIVLAYFVDIHLFFDDAYIHARIAENFLHYGQPVFNEGSDVFKLDSSTGYLFLISFLSLFIDTLVAIKYVEWISIVVSITGLFYLVSLFPSNLLKNTLIIICIIPFLLLSAYGGMETSLTCMLIILAVLFFHHKKDYLFILTLAIACWFRFELILLLSLVIFYYVFFQKKRLIILYAFPVLLLFLIELLLFGSIIPFAAKAKSIGYNFPLALSFENALSFNNGGKGLKVGLLLLAAYLFIFIKIIFKRFKIEIFDIFYLFSFGLLLAWALGRSLIFPWYFCLLFTSLALAVVLNNKKSPSKFYIDQDNTSTLINYLFTLSMLLVFIGAFFFGIKAMRSDFGFFTSNKELASSIRVHKYLQVGKELYAYCPNCVLVTSEIGGLGYAFKGKVYDAFGLADPQAINFHPLKVPEERSHYSIGAIPPKYVSYKDPDLVIAMSVFFEAFNSSEITKKYFRYLCPVYTDINRIVFGNDLIIFSKKDIPSNVLKKLGCFAKKQ